MEFNWYNIFNMTELLATDLVSRNISVFLEGIGETEVLVTRGQRVAIVYEDVMLPVEFNSENPFILEGQERNYAVYKDFDENVWLGIEVEA